MVAIYFDKAFIKYFGERTDLSDQVINDFFCQFIKKIRGVQIIVNIDSLNELNELILNNEYYSLISEIASIQLSDFKSQLSDETFCSDGAITKLFFVENCDENELQTSLGYYFISNTSLKDKWKVFLTDREDNELIIKSNPDPSEMGIFRSWKDLNQFSHTIKNILVFDLYVMANKKNQSIVKNILPCITQLLAYNKGKADDLTIFTKDLPDNNKKAKELQGIWEEDDFKTSFNYLKPLTTQINNIAFVKYDETKNLKADSEHNRFILTNYFFIRLEAGINIFKDNAIGKVNHRDTIKFDSLLKNRIRNIAMDALRNIKQYTTQLNQKDTKVIGPGKLLEHYYFSPTLNCRFLK